MITIEQIKEDLNEIKYYYSRKEFFDKASTNIGINKILEKVALYNEIICLAKPRLYDIYVSLYLQNETQSSLSDKLCYSREYIYKLNKQLVKFFHEQISKKEVQA